MKQILYIGNKLSNSGNTVTSIETLGSFLQQEGFQVITSSSKKNKVLRFLDMLFSTVKYSKKVSHVLIDTYSTQNFYYAVFVTKLCRLFNIEYIPILRGGNLPFRIEKSPKLSKALFEGAKINIAPSHYLLNAFKENGYSNLIHIPNTIKLKNYTFLKRETLELKLLWVRSFSKIYNPLLAIKIVENLLKKNIEVELCMVGPEKDGSFEECQKIVNQKKLPIRFTGGLKKEEWLELSKEYDIFINTTNFDNTPVSVIEAMALGLPVISTNVGGVPYLIEHNKTGVLVPPNDAQAFVEEIERLIVNPKKAIEIAENARKKVKQFDWEIVKEKWNEVLSE